MTRNDEAKPLDQRTEKPAINVNEFDIIHLFGKEKLEEIQETISKVTGLAFVTVDYKGEPVTEPTCFTSLCKCVRENPLTERGCWSSDAYGAIQAATTKKTSIYYCPCGLLEVAIPLVVKGHYLGGFIGGQVACTDAPDDVVRLETIFKRDELLAEAGIDMDLKKDATTMTYKQFCDVADLATMVINQLRDMELTRMEHGYSNQEKVDALDKENQNLKYQNKIKDLKISSMSYARSSQFVMDTVTAIANMAMVEGALETNEALIKFADYMKNLMGNNNTFWPLSEELDNVGRYLEIRKMQLGDRLNYSIEVSHKMKMWKTPQQILPVFVQQAIDYGIAMNESGGTVKISGTYNDEDVILYVEDNGPGFDAEKIEQYFSPFRNNASEDGILQSVEETSKRMRILFGNDYDVVTEIEEGKGRRVCIRYPRYFNERIDVDVSDSDRR